jgi:alpha-L-arabinofuranosidase
MARVRIDPTRTLGQIDRRIYGNFAEHLGRCIYGGIYEPGSPLADEDGFRRDVLEAVRRLQVPVLRWPGGNFVSGYHWEDGIGPHTNRPVRRELAWFTEETNQFGTDEFLQFCRKVPTEPYICVNMGTGTLDEAANWVEYCNGTGSTYHADLRRKNGHESPYGVKLWGLGNEMYGKWQIGQRSPDSYATAAIEFGKLMKWTDPSIQLVLCGHDQRSSPGVISNQTEWNWTALTRAGHLADYLSMHAYWGKGEDEYTTVVSGPFATEEMIQQTWQLIHAARSETRLKRPIHIAFDEWNVWYRSSVKDNLEERYDLKDALAVAVFLQILQRNCRAVKIANLAQLVNVIAPIFTSRDGMFLQTIYWPLLAAVRYSGPVALDIWTDSDGFTPARGLAESLPYLSAGATIDAAAGKLYVSLVNLRRDAEEPVRLELVDTAVHAEGRLHLISGPSPDAVNSFEAPETVIMRSVRIDRLGSTSTITMPPHAAAVLELSLA